MSEITASDTPPPPPPPDPPRPAETRELRAPGAVDAEQAQADDGSAAAETARPVEADTPGGPTGEGDGRSDGLDRFNAVSDPSMDSAAGSVDKSAATELDDLAEPPPGIDPEIYDPLSQLDQ